MYGGGVVKRWLMAGTFGMIPAVDHRGEIPRMYCEILLPDKEDLFPVVSMKRAL